MDNLLDDLWYRSDSTVWEKRREQIRAAFVELLGEGAPVPPSAPDLQWHEERRDGDLTLRKLSFLVEADDRLYAWLVVPDGLATPAPTVMCLHGTTADAKEACLGWGQHPGGSKGTAVDLARRGFVAFVPDHFCAGERLKTGEQPYDPRPFYARHPQWSEMGKDVYDHQLCLDVLQSLPEVDGSRLGCIGHSLGGYGTVFLAALDERIAAAVSSCGITVWEDDPMKFNWSREAPGRYVHFPKLREYWKRGRKAPVDFHEIIALIAPRAFLNISAVGNDVCFPVFEPFADLYKQVEGVYKLLEAEGKFGCFFHACGHSFGQAPRGLAYAWLQEQLQT